MTSVFIESLLGIHLMWCGRIQTEATKEDTRWRERKHSLKLYEDSNRKVDKSDKTKRGKGKQRGEREGKGGKNNKNHFPDKMMWLERRRRK